MNAEQTIQRMQGHINAATIRLYAALDRERDAKSQLIHLAKHFDEYGRERMSNELIAIAEEVLGESNQ